MLKATMTGPDILDLVEDLEMRCRSSALAWAIQTPGVGYPNKELSGREAKKWYALAAVFTEMQKKVYEIVKDEFHNESCGA